MKHRKSISLVTLDKNLQVSRIFSYLYKNFIDEENNKLPNIEYSKSMPMNRKCVHSYTYKYCLLRDFEHPKCVMYTSLRHAHNIQYDTAVSIIAIFNIKWIHCSII